MASPRRLPHRGTESVSPRSHTRDGKSVMHALRIPGREGPKERGEEKEGGKRRVLRKKRKPKANKKKGFAAGGENTLTEVEVDRIRIAFNMFARQSDESLHVEDIPKALQALTLVVTGAELAEATKQMDTDKSLRVEFPSFMRVVSTMLKPQWTEDQLSTAFDEILQDEAQKEVITVDVLFHLMHRLGHSHVTTTDCQDMIRETDRTGRCTMSRSDFFNEMLK